MPRDARAPVVVPVRCRYDSFVDFVETQSVNVSTSGMFVEAKETVPLGSQVDFEFSLADGFMLLKGRAEVARISTAPPGLGLRFVEIDDATKQLIERIVEINSREGKKAKVSLDFAPAAGTGGKLKGLAGATPVSGGVVWGDTDLAIELNTVTLSYFVYNPLLNIRLGGFVVPAERDLALGATLDVSIKNIVGDTLFAGKGKVVAKHESRLGIRLIAEDKTALARLQAEVTKLLPAQK